MDAPTVGVEEEYQLVDADTLVLRPGIAEVLPVARDAVGDQVEPELHESQIEIGTAPCTSLDDVRDELTRLRSNVARSAETQGFRLVAAATHPHADHRDQVITDKPAYLDLAERYGLLATEQLVFGCHVHVAVDGAELAIEVLDRMRPWLGQLLALTGSSPYWGGVDTGFASYRTEVFSRWPTTGSPSSFASRADYDELVDQLVCVGMIDGPARLYWDVRPSARYPTVEVRVADVCTSVDDAVLLAALVRGLAMVAIEEAEAGVPQPVVRPEVVRAASWRAARHGLDGTLVDVLAVNEVEARVAIDALVDRVRPALDDADDLAFVVSQVDAVFGRGTSARRQRAAFDSSGGLHGVVRWLVQETCAGCQ